MGLFEHLIMLFKTVLPYNNEIEHVFLKNWDWPYYKWNRMNILW